MDSWSNGPGTNPHYYDLWRITPNFRSLKQQVIGNVGSVLWVVMATVGLVMLIACANIANLLLVRAESRQHELSIRAALGAGRARIARELLFESVLLGLIGGVFALGVSYAGLRLLVAYRTSQSATPQRSYPRCARAGFHLRLVRDFRIVVRLDPGIQICPYSRHCCALRRQPHRQHRPRAPTLAQCAGRCAGRHGAGSSGKRAAHDSHLRGIAQR